MRVARLGRAACTCQETGSRSTCAAYSAVVDDAADCRGERAMQGRAISLALSRQHAAAHSRPVRDIPRRLPFDLAVLVDPVALRLRRQV